jgi:hypothetical protein
MSAKLKDATRNAILSDVISAIGSTAVLCLFSGSPAGKTSGTFNADPSGLLVEVALPSSPFGTPAAGAAALANGPWTGTATSGSATAPASYRIKTATAGAVSTVIAEGTAGVGSGDVSLATAITSGQVISVSSFSLTAGNA